MLNMAQTIENGKAVLALTGRLDTVTAPELEQKVKEVLSAASSLTLDFANLEYISSAGLRVLLAAQKALTGKGGLTVTHVGEAIMEIFEVTGFSDILTIE
ncbi:MAG: STAS domain-containing protein [Clostridia bacterium]|nr:STAS domain-containing protein [Clostridia bacterium]